MRLDGKTTIVTGAARGIGAAVSRALAAQGAQVLITDVRDAEGETLAGQIGGPVAYQHLDVTDAANWDSCVDAAEHRFGGPVTVLVNNAGIVEFGTIEQQPPESFRRVMDVNLFGAWLGMRAVLPSLRRAGGGCVVNVSSSAGLVGYPDLGAYVASKWALRGLTKAAALELAPDSVRVCSVHPGPIRTPMTTDIDAGNGSKLPISRFGDPDEVASMVRFVIAEATFTTGSEFVLDGGATIGAAGDEV